MLKWYVTTGGFRHSALSLKLYLPARKLVGNLKVANSTFLNWLTRVICNKPAKRIALWADVAWHFYTLYVHTFVGLNVSLKEDTNLITDRVIMFAVTDAMLEILSERWTKLCAFQSRCKNSTFLRVTRLHLKTDFIYGTNLHCAISRSDHGKPKWKNSILKVWKVVNTVFLITRLSYSPIIQGQIIIIYP